jgi:carboxymethylenebutenolidase
MMNRRDARLSVCVSFLCLCVSAVLTLSELPLRGQPPAKPIAVPVIYKSGKVRFRAIEVQPPGKGPFPALIMLHGDFGLTEWVRNQAWRLSEKDYLVLAVDLYDGELPKTIEEAHILERGLDERLVIAKLKVAVDYLETRPAVRKDAIGIMGWDCGGGFALDAAMNDRRLKTTVTSYGRVTTDSERLASISGPVLALFAGKDEGIPPATIEQFRKAMARAGKTLAIHIYPKCGNGFMDPDSPYLEGPADTAAIADAWSKIDAHLAKALGSPKK